MNFFSCYALFTQSVPKSDTSVDAPAPQSSMRRNSAAVNGHSKTIEQQSRDGAIMPSQRMRSKVANVIVHSDETISAATRHEAALGIDSESLRIVSERFSRTSA
jgi:hypothetical protein